MKKVIALLLAVQLFCLFGCAKGSAWQEQYDLGMRYLSDGNYEEAIIVFTAAIEIDPKNAGAYLGRANAYIGLGDTDENLAAAWADFEEARGIDETNPDAWLGLADVCIRRGEYDDARGILEEALTATGNDPSIADKLEEMKSGNVTDSSGRIRRRTGYDGSGNLAWYHTYEYGPNGNVSLATSYDASGVQTGQVELRYDGEGREVVGYGWVSETGELGRLEFQYDSQGNLKQRSWSFT